MVSRGEIFDVRGSGLPRGRREADFPWSRVGFVCPKPGGFFFNCTLGSEIILLV